MNNHPLILCIETATKSCSVALVQEQSVCAVQERHGQYEHAEKLGVFIRELIRKEGLALGDLDAVAVGSGPGSYTGLRIGVSTAKGLCYALGLPLIAVDTLETMVHGIMAKVKTEPGTLFCPMLDARRMEVYTALFDQGANRLCEDRPMIIDDHAFKDELSMHKILFFGSGASKCNTLWATNGNAVFIDDFSISAKYMCRPALKKYSAANFADLACFEPGYLKDFIARMPKKIL